MVKRAYLVLGGESTGTRLVTRLLMAGGCYGDGGHEQRLDRAIPAKPRLVWRRSFPHAREWPEPIFLVERLRRHGYTVLALVVTRDWHATTQAQVRNHHAQDTTEALENLRHAYPLILQGLTASETPYHLVSYESLTQHSQAARVLLETLDLDADARLEQIYDGNAKYYESE